MSDQTLLPETVLRHFPAQVDAVLKLAQTNADFRDMCEELDAAETARERIESLAAELRDSRREECEEWIDHLMREMTDALGVQAGLYEPP